MYAYIHFKSFFYIAHSSNLNFIHKIHKENKNKKSSKWIYYIVSPYKKYDLKYTDIESNMEYINSIDFLYIIALHLVRPTIQAHEKTIPYVIIFKMAGKCIVKIEQNTTWMYMHAYIILFKKKVAY